MEIRAMIEKREGSGIGGRSIGMRRRVGASVTGIFALEETLNALVNRAGDFRGAGTQLIRLGDHEPVPTFFLRDGKAIS
jgi:hypothetical protein